MKNTFPDNISSEDDNTSSEDDNISSDDDNKILDNTNKITVSFKINCSKQKLIKTMLFNWYNTNEKFKILMNEFHTIIITKSLHHDNFCKNLHFNGYLLNNINLNRTIQLHFYINKNSIYDITSIKSII